MTRRVAGIDVGGTFTDVLLHDEGRPDEGSPSGRVHFAKIPTTTANQAEGVLAAIRATGATRRPSSTSSSTAPPSHHQRRAGTQSCRAGRPSSPRPASATRWRSDAALGPIAYGHGRRLRAAHPARPAHRSARTDGRLRRRRDAAWTRTAVRAAVHPAAGGRVRGARHPLPPLLTPITPMNWPPRARSRQNSGPMATSRSAMRCSRNTGSMSAARQPR